MTHDPPRRPAAALLLALLPFAALAAPKDTIDLYFRVRWPESVALGPDGVRLAWVVKDPGPSGPLSAHKQIYVADAENAAPRRVTAGDGAPLRESQPCWSPDGARLAFLSDAGGGGQLQLFAAAAKGGPARRLTAFSGQLAAPCWSPDGRTIALLAIEGQAEAAGATAAAAPDSGEVRERILEQRILLVDASTGRTRLASPPDVYVYEFAWSPDGSRIAYVAAPGSGDDNWWIARLYSLDVAGGGARELYRPAKQIAVPRWSPDGRRVAFIQGLMSDQGVTGGDIWSVGADGADARDLTPGRAGSPAWLAWTAPARILFVEAVRGRTAIAALDPGTGGTETLWQGDESVSAEDGDPGLSPSADGQSCAVIRSSFSQPPEVWAGRPGSWRQRTRLNAAIHPPWGRFRSIEWTCDGREVQGWLLYPRAFDPARRYPMVVTIHGGPAGQLAPGFGFSWFGAGPSAEGYFVFLPNPRGSFGRGEAFTEANVRDFGYGDLRDILSGVDAVLRSEPVDPDRLGVCGWSYGGYLTMWTVTQTGRFRAAVAVAGIANYQSYYGQNLIDQWMIPYFGASVYDDPAAYARSSPITFIKAARTPTLILVGDRDKECPAPQSYEFWHALKAQGVDTKLVVYEGEGHSIDNSAAHVEDLYERMIGWFDARLKAGEVRR